MIASELFFIMNVAEIPLFTRSAIFVLGLALILAFVRMVKGPSITDRIVALDTMAVIAISIMVLYAIKTQNALFLDVAIAMALVVFLGTVAFARSFERRMID
jgi:multicomponent Na+:H+ antiporter subunit F